jgi:hypothetical protein
MNRCRVAISLKTPIDGLPEPLQHVDDKDLKLVEAGGSRTAEAIEEAQVVDSTIRQKPQNP